MKKIDVKFALALLAVIVLLVWLTSPLNTWVAGFVIGLACYGIIRLWRE